MGSAVIVNMRCARNRRDRACVQDILPQLSQERSITVVTEDENGPVFQEAIARAEILIVIGGDGTLHRVLAAMDYRRQKVVILPIGRGNSLARDLHIKDPAAGLQALRQARFVPIDLMHVTTLDIHGRETRLNSASSIAVGYPAAVTRIAGSRFRRFGRHSYLLAAATVRQRSFSLEIRSDGLEGVKKKLTGWIANNTRHMASFVAFPQADYRDGRFDVMELNAGYFAQFLHAASALRKNPIYNPCRPFQLTGADVSLSAPQDLMVDGEMFEDIVRFHVRILPSALSCCRNGN